MTVDDIPMVATCPKPSCQTDFVIWVEEVPQYCSKPLVEKD